MVPIFKITPICCKEEPLACWEKIGPLEIQNLCFDASGIKISEILDFDVGFGNKYDYVGTVDSNGKEHGIGRRVYKGSCCFIEEGIFCRG